MRKVFSLLLSLSLALMVRADEELMEASEPATIVVGESSKDLDRTIGWSDGVCYGPVDGVRKGDELFFDYPGIHDVYKMASKEHFLNCNFTEGLLLGPPGEGPLTYTVNADDEMMLTIEGDQILQASRSSQEGTSIYFACSIGSHCKDGMQKLVVNVESSQQRDVLSERKRPSSKFYIGMSPEECAAVHDGKEVEDDGSANNEMTSVCTDPVLGDDGRYFVSCTSSPATLTPGGVVNSLRYLHYPYPKDRRVLVGERTWEFVSGDPIIENDANGGILGISGVEPVPINQLYVHHLSGRVVLGQGTEGIRRSAPDAPFPYPYGSLTGDEGDSMVFHIIDLRGVGDNWLACIECRCGNGEGTYLDVTNSTTGGVSCCSNCTAAVSPTIDYRMRYNVSWSDVTEEKPITPLLMLTADISPVLGKNFEYDVPNYQALPVQYQKEDDPMIQRLERVAPFNELFQHEFFGAKYYGPKTVRLLRCVGHLHVAALRMWIEDADTGEIFCDGLGGYGNDPNQDLGFLTSVSVSNYEGDEIKVFPSDRVVKFVTEYNASETHTGVMGMEFIFISSEETIVPTDLKLSVKPCVAEKCEPSLLPPISIDMLMKMAGKPKEDVCTDTIADSMACRFGNICDCDSFVNAPESEGCNGMYSSQMGDIEVNSLCRKYCGCPPVDDNESNVAAQGGGNDCDDLIEESPACRFGNLCDCETLVSAPESTGCGGVYSSQMGDIVIDELCPSFCNACPDDSNLQEELTAMYVELLETDLHDSCHYSSTTCKQKLSNVATCAREKSGFENLNSIVQRAVIEHGDREVRKHALLGDPSLHYMSRQEEEVESDFPLCNGEKPNLKGTVSSTDGEVSDIEVSEAPDTRGIVLGSLFGVVVLVLLVVVVKFRL